MKLQNLVSKLEKHHKKKIDLTLGRTYSLLKKLGNPQDKLQNIINVVGTNSKASMAYSLKSILNQAATTGIPFDDYIVTADLVTGGMVSLDGIHLTSRGYAFMANKFLEAELLFPQSKWAPQSALMASYSYYLHSY